MAKSIITKLTLEKWSQCGIMLDRRESYSKSFTKQFMDILYVCFAKASAYTGGNSFWGSGQDSLGTDLYQNDQLRIAGGGDSGFVPSSASGNDFPITGNMLGILVGADDTAVTPSDQRLKEVFHHGKGAALGAGVQDSGSPTDTSQLARYGASQYAYVPDSAGIFAIRGFRATAGEAKMFKTGSPGTCLMELCVIDPVRGQARVIASGTFDGNALGGTPGALAGATFTTPVDIYPGIPYALRVSAPSGNVSNSISVRYLNPTTLPRLYTPSGVPVYNFTISGTSLVELYYLGTSLSNFTASGITVSFDISCLIKNLSGGSAVIKELGISAIGEYGGGGSTQPMPYLIARDVLGSPITLADTESLLVTYTPSITV